MEGKGKTLQHELLPNDPFAQVLVGVEALGVGALEFFQKVPFIAAVDDVIADVIRLGEREHHEVVAAAAGARAGRGSSR